METGSWDENRKFIAATLSDHSERIAKMEAEHVEALKLNSARLMKLLVALVPLTLMVFTTLVLELIRMSSK